MTSLLQNETLWLGAPGIMLAALFVWRLPEIIRQTRLLVRECSRCIEIFLGKKGA